tara:strand:- start:48 stop:1025 length:978 start_codon:yes stop_codon:yes gene_type:complete
MKYVAYKEHPYALYVKSKNCSGSFPSNNLGYVGKINTSIIKPRNTIRIFCVGGSTIEEINQPEGPNSHWPAKVQDILKQQRNEINVEIINAGASGYTTAESLSEFMFRGIDMNPDILLIYHNINDVWAAQMIDGFNSDYSHARFHKGWDLNWAHSLPNINFYISYQIFRGIIIKRFGGERHLMHYISNPRSWKSEHEFDIERVNIFKRNIQNMILLSQGYGILPVIIKFEHDWGSDWVSDYYKKYPKDVMRDKLLKYIESNNFALKKLSSEYSCPYIEVGPFESQHFRDHVHFNAEGLDIMAKSVCRKIIPFIDQIHNEKHYSVI